MADEGVGHLRRSYDVCRTVARRFIQRLSRSSLGGEVNNDVRNTELQEATIPTG